MIAAIISDYIIKVVELLNYTAFATIKMYVFFYKYVQFYRRVFVLYNIFLHNRTILSVNYLGPLQLTSDYPMIMIYVY